MTTDPDYQQLDELADLGLTDVDHEVIGSEIG